MKKIAAESLIERLADWGVDTIFGLPGDGINGLFEALRRHQDRIRFVLVHHEEAAAFMACAYAKTTGRLGVCIATSGPGGVHLLNGLYDAKLDHQPVLAITGTLEDFRARGLQQTEREATNFLLSYLQNPSSLLASSAYARENIRTLMEILPRESWEAVNGLH